MNKHKKIKVFLVDDQALARKVLREGLEADPEIEVSEVLHDPLSAYDLLRRHRPDVLVLDLEMPEMDGVSFLKMYMSQFPTPTVVISGVEEHSRKMALDALAAGAVATVAMPKMPLVRALPAILPELIEQVKMAANTDLSGAAIQMGEAGFGMTPPLPFVKDPSVERLDQVIAIGVSAGGVSTLTRFLPLFPPHSPGILIVQHMPSGYTSGLADRLNNLSQIEVREAKDGDKVLPGLALLAPGGNRHMELHQAARGYQVALVEAEKVSGHRPSVDALFRSVARTAGPNAAAALLTGMGSDGARGLLEIRKAGGRTFAQDEETSVVFGMPRAAWENGAAEALLPLEDIPAILLEALEIQGS